MIFILSKYILKYLRVHVGDIGNLFSGNSGKKQYYEYREEGKDRKRQRANDEANVNKREVNLSPE